MTWWTYIFPKTVLRTSSRFNQDIRVVEEYGKNKLLVNGARQSGVYVEKLWKEAISAFGLIPSDSPYSIVVLGVAGGTVIHLLRDLYPLSTIIGVDIDTTMIDIGKKYFGLDQLQNILFHVADVRNFLNKETKQHRYDIVVLDIFNGWSVPDFVFEDTFLDHLASLRKANGTLIINYIGEKEYRPKSDILFTKLRERFPMVKDKVVYLNRLFFATGKSR